MKYGITTQISENGLIVQKLIQDEVEVLQRWILDTREAAIAKALIDLGWTPPKIVMQIATGGDLEGGDYAK